MCNLQLAFSLSITSLPAPANPLHANGTILPTLLATTPPDLIATLPPKLIETLSPSAPPTIPPSLIATLPPRAHPPVSTEAPSRLDDSIIDTAGSSESETPMQFEITTEAPVRQIVPPPFPIDFDRFSCNWVTRFYLCYDHDSRFCVLIHGPRPTSSCILASLSTDIPQESEAKYFYDRFCASKILASFEGLGC